MSQSAREELDSYCKSYILDTVSLSIILRELKQTTTTTATSTSTNKKFNAQNNSCVRAL